MSLPIAEGLAEYERGEWDASDAALLQNMVRAGTVPPITSLGADRLPGDPRVPLVLGHAAFDFIVSRAGKDGLRRFLLAVRQAPAGDLGSVYLTTFGLTADDFDRGFAEYLGKRFPSRR